MTLERVLGVLAILGTVIAAAVFIFELQNLFFGQLLSLQAEVSSEHQEMHDRSAAHAETIRRNCYAIQDMERRTIGRAHIRCPEVPGNANPVTR